MSTSTKVRRRWINSRDARKSETANENNEEEEVENRKTIGQDEIPVDL